MNMKIFVGTVILILGFPLIASATSFGGYYRISFPAETYESSKLGIIDFEDSYLGFDAKAFYNINPYLSVVTAISFSKYPVEPLTLLADYPGSLVPEELQIWTARAETQLGIPINQLTPYISVGTGLFNVSVTESRLDGSEWHFSESYPGISIGGGVRAVLYGPISLDISPTYSFILGLDEMNVGMQKLRPLDIDIGIIADM